MNYKNLRLEQMSCGKVFRLRLGNADDAVSEQKETPLKSFIDSYRQRLGSPTTTKGDLWYMRQVLSQCSYGVGLESVRAEQTNSFSSQERREFKYSARSVRKTSFRM